MLGGLRFPRLAGPATGPQHWTIGPVLTGTSSFRCLCFRISVNFGPPVLQWVTGNNNKPVEEDNLVRADFAKLLTNVSIAAVLLTGIIVSVAQGYKGFLALQDPAVPAQVELPPAPRHSVDAAADEPASYTAAYEVAPGNVAVIKASVGSSQEQSKRQSVRQAVWRYQPPARTVQAAQPDPRAMYRNTPPTSGWPGFQPAPPAQWQRPAHTPRSFARPTAVRSGFGSSSRPRVSGKSCMGFG